MIGFATALVTEHVLAPQANVANELHRAHIDPESTPIDVHPRELDILEGTTEIVGFEIGGTVLLRHTFSVALDVQTGDIATGRRIRDAIVLDLMLRTLDTREQIVAAVDPESSQTVTSILPRVDYTPFASTGSDTNASAVLVFTVETSVDR